MESFEVRETFPEKPEKLYAAWLDSDTHGAMVGSDAVIDPKVGGSFSVWDGYITGRTTELIPAKRIVQSWRTTEFPEGSDDSILEIEFLNSPEGTNLVLRHSNIPDGQGNNYKEGWIEYYFEPMKEFFSSTED